MWLNAPKAGAVVLIGNGRKTRRDERNLPNTEAANWIARTSFELEGRCGIARATDISRDSRRESK